MDDKTGSRSRRRAWNRALPLVVTLFFAQAVPRPARADDVLGSAMVGLLIYEHDCRKRQGIWEFNGQYHYQCHALMDVEMLSLYRHAGLPQAEALHREGSAQVQSAKMQGLLWGGVGVALGIAGSFLIRNEGDRGYALVGFPLLLGWLGNSIANEVGGRDEGEAKVRKAVNLFNASLQPVGGAEKPE